MDARKVRIELGRAAEGDIQSNVRLFDWRIHLARHSSSHRLGRTDLICFILDMSVYSAQLGIGHLTYVTLRSDGALLTVTLTKVGLIRHRYMSSMESTLLTATLTWWCLRFKCGIAIIGYIFIAHHQVDVGTRW